MQGFSITSGFFFNEVHAIASAVNNCRNGIIKEVRFHTNCVSLRLKSAHPVIIEICIDDAYPYSIPVWRCFCNGEKIKELSNDLPYICRTVIQVFLREVYIWAKLTRKTVPEELTALDRTFWNKYPLTLWRNFPIDSM
ncbi:unnamed protein product [Hymenolepis diminuta]|uniref:Uncharacterized protein n=1 Tax=Hymenolepis diminuta TaxID=6216 RepID=A0A564Y0G2_HYMDI|nr:unnamed protein product [Hymenolepis diminuta]